MCRNDAAFCGPARADQQCHHKAAQPKQAVRQCLGSGLGPRFADRDCSGGHLAPIMGKSDDIGAKAALFDGGMNLTLALFDTELSGGVGTRTPRGPAAVGTFVPRQERPVMQPAHHRSRPGSMPERRGSTAGCRGDRTRSFRLRTGPRCSPPGTGAGQSMSRGTVQLRDDALAFRRAEQGRTAKPVCGSNVLTSISDGGTGVMHIGTLRVHTHSLSGA